MIRFKVKPEDGDPYEIEATSRDVFTWERTNRTGKVFADLADRQSMVDMYHVAYVTARRLGLFTGTQADFESTCDLDEMEGNAENKTADPTQPARTSGRASSSRSRQA